MLKIRMQRIGKKGQAYFRLVVTEHTQKPKGRYLELLGSYDPHKKEMSAKADRVKHWMSKGAKLSPTANNLLVGRKLIEGEKVQVWKAKKKPAEAAPIQVVKAAAPTPKVEAEPEVTPVPEEKTAEETPVVTPTA